MTLPIRRAPRTAGAALVLLGLSAAMGLAAPPSPRVTLAGHLPTAAALAGAHTLGRLSAGAPVSLALMLPLHDEAGLDDFLARVSDPADSEYGHYLTPAQFAAAYSPTQADYAAVAAFAQSQGLTVTGTHSNRLVLDVAGPSAAVEAAFGVSLLQYQGADGRLFHGPDREPTVPTALAGKLLAVAGLENAEVWHPELRQPDADPLLMPYQTGSGPSGGLTPSDIKTAYSLTGVSQTGSGQTLGLFELDGYTPSDVTAYEANFKLPAVPLQNILVDGGSGALGSGASEVTLDIELQIALAPGASGIIVYEGPNTTQGVIDTYNRIASDGTAKEISTSWGEAEQNETSATRTAEQNAFKQMAGQGQTIYAAAGDKGAYDYRRKTLAVDDPGSQPYMCSVGGTSLTTNGPGGAYVSETTWNRGSGSAGGGGISTAWAIPSYQSGVVSAASKGSTTMRNVPDVSLDADPYTGYAIYYNGAWTIYGGTSCAAPLWAAFTALVNQQRISAGKGLLGQVNPAIYSIAKSTAYAGDFHDIADGSTNLFYPAVTGYDDATGWGSFQGASLLGSLAGF